MGLTRLYSWRLRGWGLLATAVLLGIGVGAASAVWVSGPAAAAVGSVLAAAVFGVASARGQALLDRRAAQREALPEHVVAGRRSGRLPRVRELDDPIKLRVHPAATVERNVDGLSVADKVPLYVPRDCHAQLWSAVARGGFVLLIGDSTAGKTRAAYEAVRALLPDHVLVAPAGRASLTTILPTVIEHRRSVVWLDDLERFLGQGGLTANAVNQMLGERDRHVLVIATLRSAEFDRYSAREEPIHAGVERDSWRVARDVLDLAVVVEMQRRWSVEELRRARGFTDDPRIRAALDKTARFGLAELLAAGPELVRDWRNAWRPGAHPRGAALVAAAVDCRRAGLHEPIPVDLLTELATYYLAEHGGALLRPEPLAEALAWATIPSHGTSSLLLPSSKDDHYLAFDYLIDLPGLDSVPPATWDTLIRHAAPRQAFDIGEAAVQRLQFRTAVGAYQKAVDQKIPDADVALARAIGDTGDPSAAVGMLADVLADRIERADPDHISTFHVRHHLATYTARAGDLGRAAQMMATLAGDRQRLLGPTHPDTLEARHCHAYYLTELGDYPAALSLFSEVLTDRTSLLGPEHPATLHTRHELAFSVGKSGDTKRAIALLTELLTDWERVLGADSTRAFQTRAALARFTGWAGDPAHAANLYRQLLRDRERVLGADHRYTIGTRYNLAHFVAQAGDHEQATKLFADLLADRRQALGSHCSDATLAADLLDSLVFGSPPGSQYVQRKLSDVLAICPHLLGLQHPVTKEITRLLGERLSAG